MILNFTQPRAGYALRVLTFFAFFAFPAAAFAQPSNDDPCNATTLSVSGSCTFQQFTNANATASTGVPAPGCANYQGGDVWFKVTVPCSGSLIFDTNTGVITDGGMAIYRGTCSNLTLIECDDDDSPNGSMASITRPNLTPGETIYIRVWEYGNDNNGTFSICVKEPPPPGPASVCNNAAPFCSSNVYTFPNTTGNTGSSTGGGIYGCLNTIPNPVWYYMQVQTSGNIQIFIEQTNASGSGIDVDFVLWGPFPDLPTSCATLSASNIVDCSYLPDPQETATIPNAVAGQYYVIMITNYSNQPGTITFSQTGGTGSTNCGIVCNITATNSGPVCPGQPFNLNVNTVSGATYNWIGPNCFSSSQQNPGPLTAPMIPGSYTYTVTATVPGGSQCQSSTTLVVSGITASASVVNTSCGNTPSGSITVNTTPAGSYTYVLNPGNISQTSPTFTGLSAGTYSITVTNSAGCSTTLNNITVSTSASATATYSVTNTCSGGNNGSITVTPNGAGPYSFTLTPGNITQTTGTFSGLAPGTYSVNYTIGGGCSGSLNGITVVAGAAPTATTSIINTSCPGVNNGSITITPSISGPYSFTLTPGNITQSGQTFNGLASGTYSIAFTGASGCSGVKSNIVVGQGAAPTATFTTTQTSCPGVNNGTIAITPSIAGPYSFTINPGNVTQSSSTFTNLASGTYSIAFTGAGGCSGVLSNINVAAGPAPVGTAVSTNTSCPTRNDGTITITPTGSGPYTFTLMPGNITQSNATFTGLAPGTYNVSFTNGAGCNGTVSSNPMTIIAGPYLASTTTLTQPQCANINDGVITINANGTAPFTYTLNPGNITQSSPTFSGLAPGNYTYSFTDGPGCTGSGTAVLSTNPALTLTVSKTMPLCNGNSNGIISLNAGGGVAGYQYALSPFTSYQPSGTFNSLPAGTYTFRVKDNVGCTKDTTVTLAEPTLLTASATNSIPATCNGNDGSIVVTGTGGTPVYTYSIDGSTYQSSNTFTAPAVGPYPSIKVKDAKGCIANASTTVALVDTMRLEVGADTTVCLGKSVRLNPQTNPQTNIFTWTAITGSITSLDNPNIKQPLASPTDTARYELTATWGACSRKDTVTVNVLDKPIAYAGKDTAICFLTTATLRGSATHVSGPLIFTWTPGTYISDPKSAVTTVTPPGSGIHNYTLTVEDNYGCGFSTSDIIRVTVQPPVPATAGHDTIAVKGVPHQLFGSGGSQYLWAPAGPLDNPFKDRPLATLVNDTKFTLIVTDVAGCIGYDTVFVKVYEGPTYYIPNAFSPNGDGLNDIFRPVPAGIVSTEYFRVFNRYGELVFQTNEWLKGWDGSFRGKKQPMGVYVWMIKGLDRDGKVIERQGTVMLVQ